MSSYKHDRSAVKCCIAVLCVLAMAATTFVPLFDSASSDAFADGEVGYTVEILDGVTDAEFAGLPGGSKEARIESMLTDSMALPGASAIMLDLSPATASEVSSTYFSYALAFGEKVSNTDVSEFESGRVAIDGASAKFTFTGTSDMFVDSPAYMNPSQKDVYDAVVGYFGDSQFKNGDVVVVTGNVHVSFATKASDHYERTQGSMCVVTKKTADNAMDLSYSLKYSFTRADVTKEITMSSHISGYGPIVYDYSYLKEFSLLTAADFARVTVTNNLRMTAESLAYTVGEKTYAIDIEDEDMPTVYDKAIDIRNSVTDPDFTVTPVPMAYKQFKNTDHIKVSTSYSDAEHMYNRIYNEAADDFNLLYTALIAVLVIGVLAGFAYYMLIVKKKGAKPAAEAAPAAEPENEPLVEYESPENPEEEDQ